MDFLNLAKKITIDSQFYVSLMATFLAVFFMLEQNTFRFSTVILLFITYLSGYTYTKYQKASFFTPIMIGNILAGILCLILILIHHDQITLCKWLTVIILGFLYNSNFLNYYIRKIPLLKIFYVGLVWGLMNGWVIFEQFQIQIFFITFFYITALVLPFDIRDMKADEIITFPNLIGIYKTKILAYLMILTSIIIALNYLATPFSVSFLISGFIATLFVYFSDIRREDFYYSFGVETCCGIGLIIYKILEILKVF